MTEYKCPYCFKGFQSWKSVRAHTSTCLANNNEYCICIFYGPIKYTDIDSYKSINHFKKDYPNLSFKPGFFTDIKRKGKSILKQKEWSSEEILEAIKEFYILNNKVPQQRYFQNNLDVPNRDTIQKHFGSFNKAIEAAGLIPNIQNGFGRNTYGKDGILYSSGIEAYFADTYLYNNYTYEYEPKYPNRWLFDFYIKELELYIEIDGGFTDAIGNYRTKLNNKIQYCKNNNIKLKVLLKDDIYKKDFKLHP